MSKSEDSDYSRINLKDSSDEIVKKIKKQKLMPTQLPKILKIMIIDQKHIIF